MGHNWTKAVIGIKDFSAAHGSRKQLFWLCTNCKTTLKRGLRGMNAIKPSGTRITCDMVIVAHVMES